MKQKVILALREMARHLRGAKDNLPPAVQLAIEEEAAEYDNMAANIEAGTVQLRQVGQLRTVK